jgi:hypothetical protein
LVPAAQVFPPHDVGFVPLRFPLQAALLVAGKQHGWFGPSPPFAGAHESGPLSAKKPALHAELDKHSPPALMHPLAPDPLVPFEPLDPLEPLAPLDDPPPLAPLLDPPLDAPLDELPLDPASAPGF